MELNPFALPMQSADTWNGKPVADMSKDQLIDALKAMVRAYESQWNAASFKQATPFNDKWSKDIVQCDSSSLNQARAHL